MRRGHDNNRTALSQRVWRPNIILILDCKKNIAILALVLLFILDSEWSFSVFLRLMFLVKNVFKLCTRTHYLVENVTQSVL